MMWRSRRRGGEEVGGKLSNEEERGTSGDAAASGNPELFPGQECPCLGLGGSVYSILSE